MRSRPALPSSFEEVVEDIAGAEGMGAKKQESEVRPARAARAMGFEGGN